MVNIKTWQITLMKQSLYSTDLRYMDHPFPSDVRLVFTLTRAEDKQILNGPKPDNGTEFFIHLKEFELYVKRLVLNPTLYSKIEERLTSSPLNYYYYRLQEG